MSSRKISEKPVRAAATEKVAKSNPQKSKFHLEFPAKNGAAQKLAWMGYQNNDVLFMTGPAGTGKALPITSVLYKKNGPIFMKDVKIGDQIASDDGNFYNVTGVYPQGKKQKYKISFKDGKSIDCCEEHLWEISSNCNGWKNKIFNTKYLYENFLTPSGRTHLSIRCTDPVEFKEKEFNISPYVMGVLLAEGCFRSSRVSFTSMDEEIVQRVQKELNEEYIVKSSTKNPIDHSIKIKNKSNNVNSIKNTLVNFGLWDLKSVDKFIPNEYLYGSVQQRIDLLRGLMDGDGTVSKKSGMPIFYTSSLPLLTNFVELVNSLGGTCKVREKEASYKKDNVIVKCHKSYVCHVALKDINCFSLERKSNLCLERKKYFPKRIIKNVVKLDEYVDMQCISIDSPNNLYLTDDYIVTHNTYLAMAFAINDILLGVRKRIILTRPIVEAGESLGFLPGTFEEKVNPYMLPLLDSLYKLVGEDNPQRDLIDKSIEIAPIAFMRGRSQPLDVKILTPSGYVNMGCLSVGDFVMGANGLKTQINGIYPQGELDVYKVSFTDGTSVECSADHLWDTTTVYERKCKHNFSTKTTTEIMNSVKYGKKRYNHQVPICDAINFDSNCTNVPIDPYVLGALLGDGNLSTDASITLTSADNQIFDEVEKRLPQDLQLNEVKDDKPFSAKQVRITSNSKTNELKQSLRSLELLGTLSHSKFIPEVYKTSTVNNRLQLLRGLLDTDGCCFEQENRNPRVQYYSVSEQLAKDVAYLVHSLGGTASVLERTFTDKDKHELRGRQIIHNHSVWVVSIRMLENPFILHRKANKFKPLSPLRAIKSIEKVGRKECQCIKVDAEDNLYLTDHCIVTHNTFDDAVCIFDESQNATMKQLKLFLTRFGKNSKVIVTGDPGQSDIPGPVALIDVMSRLESVPNIAMIKFSKESIIRNPLITQIVERLGE